MGDRLVVTVVQLVVLHNKMLDQPVFKTGMFAVVLAYGLCWMVNTFIGDQSGYIPAESKPRAATHWPEAGMK